jgi:plastocyanin
MTRTFPFSVVAGALLLAPMRPAAAQVGPMQGPSLWDYTGLLTPLANVPPRIPSTWIYPNYVFDYQMPRVVYVPVRVPVAPEQPAVEAVQVKTISLQRGASPAEVRVNPATVVTWMNSDKEDHTLVVSQPDSSGMVGPTASEQWQIPANSSVSLDFHRPGIYSYYRLDAPDQRSQLIVTN